MISDHYSARLSTLDIEMIKSIPMGGNWRDIPTTIASKRLQQIRIGAMNGKGSRSTYYGRLRWDRPAYTISTYFNRPGNGCYIHPAADRLITIREAARLQSFPDNYRFTGSVRYRQMQVGNAVPPILAYQIATVLPSGRYVDLFCGAGGLSLGVEWAGSRCVAAIDNDKNSLETFAFNRNQQTPEIRADLSDDQDFQTTIGEVRHRLNGERLDLVIGGPPCQGFSTAGNNTKDDPRNGLVWAYLRFVEEMDPWAVLIENVPALAWKRTKGLLSRIQNALEKLGYATSSIIAHAEGYGVPQLRRRLFIIGLKSSTNVKWPLPSFQIMEPSFTNNQPMQELSSELLSPLIVRDAIEDLPFGASMDIDSTIVYDKPAVSQYAKWARGEVNLSDIIPKVKVKMAPLSPMLAL